MLMLCQLMMVAFHGQKPTTLFYLSKYFEITSKSERHFWRNYEISGIKTNNFVFSINLKVKKGSLVAIVGQVGCGKSSLISALLGGMEKLNGNVLLKVWGFNYFFVVFLQVIYKYIK